MHLLHLPSSPATGQAEGWKQPSSCPLQPVIAAWRGRKACTAFAPLPPNSYATGQVEGQKRPPTSNCRLEGAGGGAYLLPPQTGIPKLQQCLAQKLLLFIQNTHNSGYLLFEVSLYRHCLLRHCLGYNTCQITCFSSVYFIFCQISNQMLFNSSDTQIIFRTQMCHTHSFMDLYTNIYIFITAVEYLTIPWI